MIGGRLGRLGRLGHRPAPHLPAPTPPPDPLPRGARAAVADPDLAAIRAGLLPYRRRLWIRRAVRRAWIVGAVAVGAEIVLWAMARVMPLEVAPSVGLAIPVVGVAVLGILAARARPSVGETAFALDREAGLRDRTASALALAVEPGLDPGFVARQRTDALCVLRSTEPTIFRPPVPFRTAAATVFCLVFLVPLLLLPNSQDQRIADDRRLHDETARQADKVERIADDLAAKARTPDDPRAQVAQQLKDLARLLRDHPGDLDAALAKVGSVEGELRAQIDPSTEQRGAALASLSRGLSNAATGRPDANRAGDPATAAQDLRDLAARLDNLTSAERKQLADQLAGLQSTARQADGSAGVAAGDGARSLATGDIAGAKDAIGRLADTVQGADRKVTLNRDLTGAAARLQETRRNLANAGRPGLAQAGQSPGSSQGQGAGQSPGTGGQSPGTGQGQGTGGSPGTGQGQGQGQGQGSIGGGGSNARYLGSGIGGSSGFRGPTSGNRPSVVGADQRTVFAPFDRLGKPGDPSYVAGTGGDGQTTQGNQTGTGTGNPALTPYEHVYADFHAYALTSLDRSYIPLAAKDYVRDYFSSLDPSK
jgi:hypothetical protein